MVNIITVSREFGSGGRTVAKDVAEKLGYDYYDSDIIEKIAKESGLSEKYVEDNVENSPGNSIFSMAFAGRNERGESISDMIWLAQCKVIKEIADKGKCVIVGRCADYILSDRDDVLNVFIHADPEKRIERIINVYGESNEKPEKRLAAKDKRRKTYYKFYTDRKWGDYRNYHLALDSGVMGFDKCEELIINVAESMD